MKLVRQPGYAWAVVALLAVEIAIALFVRDRIVRPYVGDTLAVILVHCFFRAVTAWRPLPCALAAMAVATVIEFGQLAGVLHWIGLGENRIARTVLGSGFEAMDFVAYGAGAAIAVAVERLLLRAQ